MPRSKAYDPEEALEAAMRAFWKRGYASTSLTDLTSAMGINKFSLYSAFGDKRAVFLAALDRYSKTIVTELLSLLDTEESALDAIRTYFETLIEGATSIGDVTGCLMTNSGSEMGPDDAEVRRKVQKHQARIKLAFKKALILSKDNGELSRNADPDILSTNLMMCTQSIAMIARTKPKLSDFKGYVDWLVASLSRE